MPQHYEKAPITEAVIDFRIESGNLIPEQVADFKEALIGGLGDKYLAPDEMTEIQMAFERKPDAATSFVQQETVVGIRFASVAGDRVLQARKNCFTFSHLPPYTSWDTFKADAQNAWQAFAKAAAPKKIVRVAIRVINKIEIPTHDVKRYINMYPHIESGVIGEVGTFVMQLQTPVEKLVPNCKSLINVIQAPSEVSSGSTVILDFDLFVDGEFAADSDEVWSLLDKISKAKNTLFESSITNDTREIIK